MGLDYLAYGSVLKTGYSSGEITFSLASVLPNLQHMPARLAASMPMLVLAVGALGWMALRAVASRERGSDLQRQASYRREAVVGFVLAGGWLAIWGLYAAYDWTVRMGSMSGGGIPLVRFYLPAIGLIALLGTWLLVQLPRWLPVVILIVLIALGARSYPNLVAGGPQAPGGLGGAPGVGGPVWTGGPPPAIGGPGGKGGPPPGIGGTTGRPPPGVGGPGGAPAPAGRWAAPCWSLRTGTGRRGRGEVRGPHTLAGQEPALGRNVRSH